MASKEAENQWRQQQLKNEREDSGFSTEGIVGAAVASAAATALFFRSGGASKFARALDAGYKYSKELRGIADRRLSGQNVTISNYRNFFNDAKFSWQKARQQAQNTSVNLNIEGNNFFKYAHSLNSAYYKHEYIARQEYRNKYFEQPVKDFFNSKFDVQNMDYNRRLRFNNYINQMSSSIGDAEDMVRTKNSFKFAQDDLPIVNTLDKAFTRIQNSLSGDEENSIRKQVNKQFEEAVKQGFNIDKLEQEFGSSRSKTFIDKLVETTLKDRAATTRDILENKDKIRSSFTYSFNKDKQEQLIDTTLNELEAMRAKIRKDQGEEAEQRFLDLTPDNSVRIDAKGRLYSVDSVQSIKNDLITFGASTLPGKILKLGEIRNNINTPSFYYFAKGSVNPVLAGKLNQETNKNNQILDASYYQIGKELYKLNDDTIEKMNNVDDLRLISGRYGATQRLLSQLTGNTRYQESSNKLFKLLDIGQDREDFRGNFFSRLRSRFNKKDNEDWRGNVFNRILYPTKEQTDELLEMYQLRNSTDASIKQQSFSYAVNYLQKAEYIESFLKANTYELSRSTIDKLMPNASKEAQNYLNVLLNNNNEDMVHNLMSIVEKDRDSILNNDLNRLINRLIRNQTRAQSSISLRTDRANTSLSSNLSDLSNTDFGNESADFYQQLRTEISKEAFLQHALSNSNKKVNGTFVLNHDSILDLLKASDLDRKEEIDTRRLALFASFQEKTGINNIRKNRTSENIWKEVTRINSVLNSSDNVIDKEIRNTINNLSQEQISSFESISNIGLDSIENPQSYPEWIHIGTGIGPIELIKSLNNSQKAKSSIKKMFTQFNAGRDNLADITTYTEMPYFFMSRLSDALNTFGLGFSRDSMGSSLELLGSFALKRVMPVAFGATYLEWADDTSQELTGTSIAGAAANGIANVDLAFRRFSDTIGLTDWLKEEKQINPIMQYWGDHNEFMSYEERKKWYESGYEPVRKGAWWTFGGVSEARGSEITYWQPSFARRINSDYLDKSLYDDYFDKWSHSLLPTPTNLLSPLFAILDPYWLEEKHEDDRPYPISGPMFAEGTPWGAILNPTIGELIKPEKELHPWRLNNGIDAFALIHQINNYIKTKATDITETNAFAISGSSITPVSYTDYNAPTEDSHIYSVQISNDGKGNIDISGRGGIYGRTGNTISNNAGFNKLTPSDLLEDAEDISTTGYIYNVITGTNYPIQNGAIITNKDGEVGTLSFNTNDNNLVDTRLGLADSLTLDAIINGDDNNIKRNLRDLVKGIDPKEIIFRQNTSIKQKASANINALNDEEGFVSPEKLRYFTPSQGMDLLNDPTTVTELINASKGADFVKDIETSSRLISGIYGYMLGSLTGFGDTKGDKIAQSSNMTSFSRTFWDSNIGGAGGDVMEIVRRFIPSYKSGLNPLMNEMPDWLPERFRFGDPFCVSEDTLIEINNLQFCQAGKVNIGYRILSHKGKNREVSNMIIRNIKSTERVYQLKIATLSAVQSKFSENHPILTVVSPKMRRIKNKGYVKIKIYEQANKIIKALMQGVTSKRKLAQIADSNIDDVYRIFNLLKKENIIEDNKKDKHNIIPKELKLFDLDILRHGFEWKYVKNIKSGDYVAYPIQQYVEQDIIIDMADVLSEYPHTKQYVYISGTMTKISDFPRIYEYMEKNGVQSFKHGERKKFLLDMMWNDKAYENAQNFIKKHKVPERINRYIKVTPELAYAFGLFLAEGYTSNDNASTVFALHAKEENLFLRAVNAFKMILNYEFNYTFKRKPNTNGAEGHIYNKPISRLLYYLFGKYAKYKNIPDCFYNAQKEIILRLLEGYLDGNGSYFLASNNQKRFGQYEQATISATSCNLIMLLQLRKLLLRFEVVASISFANKKETTSVIKTTGQVIHAGINYHFVIRGISATKLIKLIWNKNLGNPNLRSSHYYFFVDNYVCMRVLDVNEIQSIKKVWGFEVGIDNSFCTAGIATHNTSIPKGEMRLPGKGYESLNKLHPDMYGDYGAFDRFKILADISPFSPEFKLWRQIAKQTVTDPNLVAEMDEITDRVNQQGKKHDFYDYKIVSRGLEFQNVIVSEVLGYGKFRSGDTIYKLAGAKVKGNADETMVDVLGKYIHPGDEITIAIDSDMSAGINNDADSTINAAVFNQDGQNVAQLMLQNGDASKKKGDTSAPATLVNYSGTQKMIAYASEVIAHADVPWLSDQFLRVRTPLESYEAEQVYGTPYQSWEHPINTFLMPAIERAIHEGSFVPPRIWTYLRNTEGIGPYTRKALDATFILTNRGAFIGAALTNLYRPYGSKDSGSTMIRNARLGANLVNIGHFLSGGTSYASEMYSGAMIGYDVGKFLEKELPAKYAAIGALIGASYRFLLGDNKNWIPDRTKEKWEVQEYFDRLTYLKYMGLYHMAAERAKDEEDVDIEDLIERNAKQEEKRQAQLGRMKSIKEALRKTPDSPERQRLMDILNNKINALATQTSIVTGGEWTHTALIYRQAAQNTMTALQPGASWSQIVTALPTNDREYFMEFVKERNPERRQEIMRTVSPQLRKALNLAWGKITEESDIEEENKHFFSSHVLPSGAWIGWRPDIDLKDVEVKTIANEGMNLSDFGFYESQLRQPEVINAPDIQLHGSTAELTNNLKRILEGQGLENVDISISSASAGTGHQIIANIGLFTGLKDLQTMTDESLKYAVN